MYSAAYDHQHSTSIVNQSLIDVSSTTNHQLRYAVENYRNALARAIQDENRTSRLAEKERELKNETLNLLKKKQTLNNERKRLRASTVEKSANYARLFRKYESLLREMSELMKTNKETLRGVNILVSHAKRELLARFRNNYIDKNGAQVPLDRIDYRGEHLSPADLQILSQYSPLLEESFSESSDENVALAIMLEEDKALRDLYKKLFRFVYKKRFPASVQSKK